MSCRLCRRGICHVGYVGEEYVMYVAYERNMSCMLCRRGICHVCCIGEEYVMYVM